MAGYQAAPGWLTKGAAPVPSFDRNPGMDDALAGEADKARTGLDQSITDVQAEAERHAKKGEELAGTIKSARDQLGGLKPPSVPDVPETPQPKYRDPMEAFGSAASLVGIFGSLLTRRPLQNALNAAAGVMNAQRGQDRQAYDDAIQTWKLNFEKAKTLHEWQKDVYEEIINKISTDTNLAKAEFEAYGTALGDKQIVLLAQEKRFDDIVKILEFRDRQMTQAQTHADMIAQREADRESRETIARENREDRRNVTASTEAAGWQLMTDPNNKDKDGNPTQYRYNVRTGEAKTLTGEAYSPKGAQKLGTGSGSAAVPQTPEEEQAAAAQASTGQPLNQIIPGYGTPATIARNKARNDAIRLIQEQNPGMTPMQAGLELSRRSVEFIAGRASTTQLTTMLGATRQAVAQLDFNIDKTKEEMKKLGSTDLSPIFNAIIRGEEKWTGQPEYASLFFYMNAVATESARILSGGQASRAQLAEGARKEAQGWANVNMTPASFEAVAKAMHAEGETRIMQFQDALRFMTPGGPAAPGAFQAPSPAATPKTGASDFSHLWQ